MRWLGLDWDGDLTYQTQRADVYNRYVDKLLETGHAYWCSCTPEEVDAMRNFKMAHGGRFENGLRPEHLDAQSQIGVKNCLVTIVAMLDLWVQTCHPSLRLEPLPWLYPRHERTARRKSLLTEPSAPAAASAWPCARIFVCVLKTARPALLRSRCSAAWAAGTA